VSYAAFKNHCSLFPGAYVLDRYGEEVKPFVSGKGTLRFTVDHPIPAPSSRKIVKVRLEEIAEARRR
jgi:uncharacterized protein YdhG (YjbR/CyaY superfamily)